MAISKGARSQIMACPRYKDLCIWLEAGRLQRGLSKTDLANTLGVDMSFIHGTEDADRRLDVVELIRYCAALNLNPEEGLSMIIQSTQGISAPS